MNCPLCGNLLINNSDTAFQIWVCLTKTNKWDDDIYHYRLYNNIIAQFKVNGEYYSLKYKLKILTHYNQRYGKTYSIPSFEFSSEKEFVKKLNICKIFQ